MEIGRATRWKLRISAVVWFVLALGFLLGAASLLDLSPLIVVGIAVVALILAWPAAWLVRRLFRGQRQQGGFYSLLKAWLALLFALTIAVSAPLYYLALRTELTPLTVPQATLTNGSKTLVFQGMMHVGSEGFYKSVVYDVEQALADGAVIYYEGVLPSPDGDKWLSDTVSGGGDLSENYKMIAGVCGLQFQLDYFKLLQADMQAHPERHVAADVSAADMMHEYDRLMQVDPNFAAAMAEKTAATPEAAGDSGGPDIISNVINWFQTGTPEQRRIGGVACRGLMTMLLSRKSGPSPLDPVILDFRNQALADRIMSEPNPQIYATYGAAHLPGLLADLQARDPEWRIASLKWMRPIESTEELSGEL